MDVLTFVPGAIVIHMACALFLTLRAAHEWNQSKLELGKAQQRVALQRRREGKRPDHRMPGDAVLRRLGRARWLALLKPAGGLLMTASYPFQLMVGGVVPLVATVLLLLFRPTWAWLPAVAWLGWVLLMGGLGLRWLPLILIAFAGGLAVIIGSLLDLRRPIGKAETGNGKPGA